MMKYGTFYGTMVADLIRCMNAGIKELDASGVRWEDMPRKGVSWLAILDSELCTFVRLIECLRREKLLA